MHSKRTQQNGFSLIELVIGIVVLGIGLTVINNALVPMYTRSIDPWHQVRATELGQSLMNEILLLNFDENSGKIAGTNDRISGVDALRCDETETGAAACTTEANFGPDGSPIETRSAFNDVDDYDGFNANANTVLNNILGTSIADNYRSYVVAVNVTYAGSDLGQNNQNFKRIDITVTTPTGTPIQFSSYRGNW